MKHAVMSEGELGPGEMRAVEVDGIEIVVVRTPGGTYRALRDRCPHYGATLSHGDLQPYTEEAGVGAYHVVADRFVIECPWHGYEFDVDDGRCPADPTRLRVRSYDVAVEDGVVYVER
jgi:nitrite reductase/ring-hydroxylating ferredoxin subunit